MYRQQGPSSLNPAVSLVRLNRHARRHRSTLGQTHNPDDNDICYVDAITVLRAATADSSHHNTLANYSVLDTIVLVGYQHSTRSYFLENRGPSHSLQQQEPLHHKNGNDTFDHASGPESYIEKSLHVDDGLYFCSNEKCLVYNNKALGLRRNILITITKHGSEDVHPSLLELTSPNAILHHHALFTHGHDRFQLAILTKNSVILAQVLKKTNNNPTHYALSTVSVRSVQFLKICNVRLIEKHADTRYNPFIVLLSSTDGNLFFYETLLQTLLLKVSSLSNTRLDSCFYSSIDHALFYNAHEMILFNFDHLLYTRISLTDSNKSLVKISSVTPDKTGRAFLIHSNDNKSQTRLNLRDQPRIPLFSTTRFDLPPQFIPAKLLPIKSNNKVSLLLGRQLHYNNNGSSITLKIFDNNITTHFKTINEKKIITSNDQYSNILIEPIYQDAFETIPFFLNCYILYLIKNNNTPLWYLIRIDSKSLDIEIIKHGTTTCKASAILISLVPPTDNDHYPSDTDHLIVSFVGDSIKEIKIKVITESSKQTAYLVSDYNNGKNSDESVKQPFYTGGHIQNGKKILLNPFNGYELQFDDGNDEHSKTPFKPSDRITKARSLLNKNALFIKEVTKRYNPFKYSSNVDSMNKKWYESNNFIWSKQQDYTTTYNATIDTASSINISYDISKVLPSENIHLQPVYKFRNNEKIINIVPIYHDFSDMVFGTKSMIKRNARRRPLFIALGEKSTVLIISEYNSFEINKRHDDPYQEPEGEVKLNMTTQYHNVKTTSTIHYRE